MSLTMCSLRGLKFGGYRLETMPKKLRASGQIGRCGEMRSVRYHVSEPLGTDKS